MGATFAMAAIPARYAMERLQWTDAMADLRPAPNTPHTEAITPAGAAAARAPKLTGARHRQAAAIRDRELELKDGYWAEQVDIRHAVAEAWSWRVAKTRDRCRGAAEAETDRSPPTQGRSRRRWLARVHAAGRAAPGRARAFKP
jgi:hypothetical protein